MSERPEPERLGVGADIPSELQVYLLTHRAGNGVAVFKPDDEERVPEEGHT